MTTLLQTAALLAIFGAEVESAGVEEWERQLHGQITVESAWRPNAVSPAGAAGLTQFMRPTWADIAPYTSPSCDGIDRTDPACSVRAQIVYMGRLRRIYRDANSARDQWALAWAAYNGGMGNLRKERRACRRRVGCDPDVWYDSLEHVCKRSESACHENRNYPRRIEAAMDRER